MAYKYLCITTCIYNHERQQMYVMLQPELNFGKTTLSHLQQYSGIRHVTVPITEDVLISSKYS